MTTPAAIILGSALIAAAIVGAQFVPRYQIVSTGFGTLRIETRTGDVSLCGTYSAGSAITCRP